MNKGKEPVLRWAQHGWRGLEDQSVGNEEE